MSEDLIQQLCELAQAEQHQSATRLSKHQVKLQNQQTCLKNCAKSAIKLQIAAWTDLGLNHPSSPQPAFSSANMGPC